MGGRQARPPLSPRFSGPGAPRPATRAGRRPRRARGGGPRRRARGERRGAFDEASGQSAPAGDAGRRGRARRTRSPPASTRSGGRPSTLARERDEAMAVAVADQPHVRQRLPGRRRNPQGRSPGRHRRQRGPAVPLRAWSASADAASMRDARPDLPSAPIGGGRTEHPLDPAGERQALVQLSTFEAGFSPTQGIPPDDLTLCESRVSPPTHGSTCQSWPGRFRLHANE